MAKASAEGGSHKATANGEILCAVRGYARANLQAKADPEGGRRGREVCLAPLLRTAAPKGESTDAVRFESKALGSRVWITFFVPEEGPPARGGQGAACRSSRIRVCSSRLAPLATSLGRVYSCGEWLIPPTLGTKIRAEGAMWAMFWASWAAPLGIRA